MRPIKMLPLLITCLLALLLTTSLVTAQTTKTTAEKLAGLGAYPCPNSDFTCLKVTVPLDHSTPTDKRTIDVVFGVLPATGERKGMFVTATGGPGSSGLELADSYANTLDPAIKEHYDLVFFDQRGARQSGDLECPNALGNYQFGSTVLITSAQTTALEVAAQTFAQDCMAEIAKSGVPADTLKFYGTSQAVEDLETFRQLMGDDKIWLYGESYGTEYAQTFATFHPEHLAALVLDGTVDMTTSLLDFKKEQVQAFNDVLVITLQDCNRNVDCASEMGGDAVTFYDDLVAELGRRGIDFKFPVASGRLADRTFTLDMLETIALNAVYTESGRMLFQRALAAAAQGDFVPLARIYYASNQFPSTSRLPKLGDAADNTLYYVISCADHNIINDKPEAQATAYLQAGTALEATGVRLFSGFYNLLPCAYWQGNASTEVSKPLVAENIPTFVLGATADPATPVQSGDRVFSHLSDGYLFTTDGGAHVTFNRANNCPDTAIKDFLVSGTKPAQRETRCEGVIATPYVPLAPSSVRAFDTPLEILDAVYNEINYLPENYFWDGSSLIMASCSTGGILGISTAPEGAQINMSDCAFFNGFNMTGTGLYDQNRFIMNVRITGFENGTLTYTKTADGKITVTGEYAGKQVDLSDTRPDSAG